MAESAPLLHDVASHDNEEFGLPPSEPIRRRSRFVPSSKALRFVTLVLSAAILGLLITNLVFIDKGYFQYYTWGTRRATEVFLKWMIPIVIFSLINVFFRIPALVNIIPDITFTSGIIACLVHFIDEFPHQQWCEGRRYPTPEPPHPRCMGQKLTVTIIMGIVSGLGIILAATYVGLLCLRVLDIFKSNFWRKHALSLPEGGVTWTISLNVLRNENETSIGISAGSRTVPKGQGPVHL